MTSLAIVLKNLPKLTKTELETVRLRLSFLLGVDTTIKVTEAWLLEGVTVELRRRGLWARNSPIPAKLLPDAFMVKTKAVQQHLLKGVAKSNLRAPERLALGVLGAAVLADYLTKIQVPISPKTLLANIEKIPVALEESFPDYWQQKLLGFCIKVG